MYYLRERKGKSARISEKIKKSIGIDVSEQTSEIEAVNETEVIENKKDDLKENTEKTKDTASKAELKKKELKKENK